MGFFEDIGKELEKAIKPTSSAHINYVSRINEVQKEYEDTIFYLSQLEKKRELNEIDQTTYESLSKEYQQRKDSLKDEIIHFQEKYSQDKIQAESVVKRTVFEKGEIYAQLTKNTSDFASDMITEAEYRARKRDLEIKARKIDDGFEQAKKTLATLGSGTNLLRRSDQKEGS